MAHLSAKQCLRAHREGRAFTLEHPARSIALHLSSWRELVQEPGVRVISYTTCMFHGSRRRKQQVLICNRAEFQSLNRVCSDPRICSRTRERHLKWRPAVAHGKVLQFTTGDEREYPLGFCEAYAECVREQNGGVFTEVFSGPNAAAVCRVMGQDLPGNRVESSRGITNELQHLAQVIQGEVEQTGGQATAARPDPGRAQAEFTQYRLSSIEAGRQPGYGKRTQLISDGLNSCTSHLREALRLSHPFRGTLALKGDHRAALEEASLKAGRLQHHRLGVLASWRKLAEHDTIVARQKALEKEAATTARRLGPLPKAALMEFLADRFGIEDKAVPRLCLVVMHHP